MRIAVITDAHANLPALKAALESIRAEGYDALFHTGNAITIGPYPAECLELLLNTPNTHFVMRNYESYSENNLLRTAGILPALLCRCIFMPAWCAPANMTSTS